MQSSSHCGMNSQPCFRLRGYHKALILQKNNQDTAGELNSSVTEVKRFLMELIVLAAQEAPGAPVLELQIGEILTRTAVELSGNDRYLSITALLPRCEQPHYLPLPFSPLVVEYSMENTEFLWHADEGRYIVVRKVPVTELPDELSVMDAILTTSDLANTYFASVNTDKPGSGRRGSDIPLR